MKPPPELVEIERDGCFTVLHLQPSPVWKQLSSLSGNTLGDSFRRMIEAFAPNEVTDLRILVDFCSVREFSGQMMAVLARLSTFARSSGGSVALCNVPVWFREILQVTRLDHLFKVFADRAEALRSCGLESESPAATLPA